MDVARGTPSAVSAPPPETPEVVRAVARALAILSVLSIEPNGLRLTEVGQRARLGPSTCHRLLATLIALDYVVQVPDSGRYLLGYKIPEMASRTEPLAHLMAVRAAPFLSDAMIASGETANLAVLDEIKARYIAVVPGRTSVRMFVDIGTVTPLHATGVGKVLLAYSDTGFLERVVRDGLEPRTHNTIIDSNVLASALEVIRQSGFAVDNEEFEDGVMCIAAPVRNHTQAVVGALSVSGPSSRLESRRVWLQTVVVTEATALSQALGCPHDFTNGTNYRSVQASSVGQWAIAEGSHRTT